MIKACLHHEYEENHLNTFFHDGLNDATKALLDLVVGVKLSKVSCNQVKAKIEEVAKIAFGVEQGVEDYLGE